MYRVTKGKNVYRMFVGRKRAEAKKKKLGKSKSTDTEEEEGDDDQDDGELYFPLSDFSLTRFSVISLPRSKSSIILGIGFRLELNFVC